LSNRAKSYWTRGRYLGAQIAVTVIYRDAPSIGGSGIRIANGAVELRQVFQALNDARAMQSLAKQNDKQYDYQEETQTAAGIISPPSAVWPCRQGADY